MYNTDNLDVLFEKIKPNSAPTPELFSRIIAGVYVSMYSDNSEYDTSGMPETEKIFACTSFVCYFLQNRSHIFPDEYTYIKTIAYIFKLSNLSTAGIKQLAFAVNSFTVYHETKTDALINRNNYDVITEFINIFYPNITDVPNIGTHRYILSRFIALIGKCSNESLMFNEDAEFESFWNYYKAPASAVYTTVLSSLNISIDEIVKQLDTAPKEISQQKEPSPLNNSNRNDFADFDYIEEYEQEVPDGLAKFQNQKLDLENEKLSAQLSQVSVDKVIIYLSRILSNNIKKNVKGFIGFDLLYQDGFSSRINMYEGENEFISLLYVFAYLYYVQNFFQNNLANIVAITLKRYYKFHSRKIHLKFLAVTYVTFFSVFKKIGKAVKKTNIIDLFSQDACIIKDRQPLKAVLEDFTEKYLSNFAKTHIPYPEDLRINMNYFSTLVSFAKLRIGLKCQVELLASIDVNEAWGVFATVSVSFVCGMYFNSLNMPLIPLLTILVTLIWLVISSVGNTLSYIVALSLSALIQVASFCISIFSGAGGSIAVPLINLVSYLVLTSVIITLIIKTEM